MFKDQLFQPVLDTPSLPKTWFMCYDHSLYRLDDLMRGCEELIYSQCITCSRFGSVHCEESRHRSRVTLFRHTEKQPESVEPHTLFSALSVSIKRQPSPPALQAVNFIPLHKHTKVSHCKTLTTTDIQLPHTALYETISLLYHDPA